MSIDDQTLPSPQPASKKNPNAPVNPYPDYSAFGTGPDFVGATDTADAILGTVPGGIKEVSLREPLHRPVPCRIFNREPTGTRRRGLKCETCGAQADQGETIVCTR